MINRHLATGFITLAGTLALAACSAEKKAAEPAPSGDVTATAETAPAAAPVAEVPPLLQGIPGLDRVPPALVGQLATDTAPHWARCGDELVAEVIGAGGTPEGFIVARTPAFTFVDAAIDVPAQQSGVTSRIGINLRSNTHVQYFGEGVSRTDISGRTVTKAGWGDEVRLTAPLPFWRADETKGVWTAEFRRNAPDAAEWTKRYRAADCAAVPARG